MKAQALIEFMVVISLILLVFVLVVGVYAMEVEEANQMRETLGGKQICLRVASTFGSFAALGGNSTYSFDLKSNALGEEYSVWINSEQKKVTIQYGGRGTTCNLPFESIVNSNGSTLFELEKTATIRMHGGVIVVEP